MSKKELEENNSMLARATMVALIGFHELEDYLTSSKFTHDPTVQTHDVIRRIREIHNAMIESRGL